MTARRLPAPQGSRIDRARPLRFRFDGREVEAFAGDTVASALLAAGVRVVGRSYKLRRPRGVYSCGIEEPCALADAGEGPARETNVRLTQVLARDGLVLHGAGGAGAVGSLIGRFADYLPAGFYYKTFMWPHWKLFEPTLRELAASARAPDAPDPERYDEVSIATDVLVVGAGLAGMQAAVAAAQAGREVLLLDGDIEPGGWALAQSAGAARDRLQQLRAALGPAAVRVRTRTSAVAVYDHGLVLAVESLESGGPPVRERLWKIRAGRIVLATGAFERPLLFPDNDRPGVMLAGAVERYAQLYGVACGSRAVLATACDSGYALARALRDGGIDIAAIVDPRPAADCGTVEAPAGVPVLAGAALVGIAGDEGSRAAHVASDSGGLHTIEPTWSRHLQATRPTSACTRRPAAACAGCRVRDVRAERAVPGVHVAGACAGVFDLDTALAHAEELGARLDDGSLASPAPGGVGRVPADTRPTAAALAALKRRPGKQFVDLHNDVTTEDVELAARENYRSVEHLKRYTTLGMAPDQGKTSNVNGLVVLGSATQRQPQQVGTTRYRPPYQPVTLNAIAGGRTGARYRPLRQLPARAFHAARGALFEEFGGWERPAAYPGPGESLLAAAEREAAQVRAGVGLFDGSPLGKIEVVGPDAADFLDLMYVGTMSTLPVGNARYGALLNENGVIVDDGIVARLGPQHFWVNATSSGVERTALAFEEWLQCEYVHHRVAVVPVTAQWGNVTVSGPRAWDLLQRLGIDDSLAPGAMKHMTMRVTPWEGEPARVLRASFNGELGYELNVPMSRGAALLQALWTAGQDLGITLYGVEALMIMRTEKGFIHVGADTDGTTLPQDVGLARGVDRKAANFVGRRSLLRPAGTDPERLQLVGLQPVDRHSRLPAGAHLARSAPPAAADGFVTST